jgi:hypothetical protein
LVERRRRARDGAAVGLLNVEIGSMAGSFSLIPEPLSAALNKMIVLGPGMSLAALKAALVDVQLALAELESTSPAQLAEMLDPSDCQSLAQDIAEIELDAGEIFAAYQDVLIVARRLRQRAGQAKDQTD